jgi:hypothetical protein
MLNYKQKDMKNQLKWVGFGLLAVLVILQFFQTDKPNKETDPKMELLSIVPASAEVADLLERACQDCHSNKTKYPWYSYIAPVSFWVTHHIDDGKKHFNMSEFGTYPAKKAAHKLEEGFEVIENGEMPMDSYTWMHPEAKLTDAEKKVLINWFKASYAAAEAKIE